MPELQLSYSLHFKYYYGKAKAVQKINWEAPDVSLEVLKASDKIRRPGQAALISHTTELPEQ